MPRRTLAVDLLLRRMRTHTRPRLTTASQSCTSPHSQQATRVALACPRGRQAIQPFLPGFGSAMRGIRRLDAGQEAIRPTPLALHLLFSGDAELARCNLWISRVNDDSGLAQFSVAECATILCLGHGLFHLVVMVTMFHGERRNWHLHSRLSHPFFGSSGLLRGLTQPTQPGDALQTQDGLAHAAFPSSCLHWWLVWMM